jgi:hypothetical protein
MGVILGAFAIHDVYAVRYCEKEGRSKKNVNILKTIVMTGQSFFPSALNPQFFVSFLLYTRPKKMP